MSIPQYDCFFNDESTKLIKWMAEEKNRLRQTKIYQVACRMEKLFRKKNYISDDSYWWGTARAHSLQFLIAVHSEKPPKVV